MQNIIVAFSGGRTSAFMCAYLKAKYKSENLIFVFANTGKEREETLEFVNKCDIEFGLNLIWLEFDIDTNNENYFKVVTFETASRKGEPFIKAMEKYGLASFGTPHCSDRLKTNIVKKYLNSIGLKNYKTAIGIRHDEQHRINRQNAEKKGYIYPLTDEIKCTSEFIRNWWDRQSFDLKIKDYQGNCDFCFKKSKRKLLTLISENENSFQWWIDAEVKYGNGYPLYREQTSAFSLLEMAKRPFRKALDKHELKKMNISLFEPDLDIEFDCMCKSS